jgi:uracil-DNA glycosylase
MDERLRQDVAAWLEFYRELGIEEFYPRPPASVPKLETRDSRPETSRLGTETPESRSPKVEVGPRLPIPEPRLPALESQPVIPDLRAATLPPQALNLFEAPPARRVEQETLEQIREDLGDCHRCRLAAGRKTIVFGQGNPHAELVFVGEGPGADEDEQGLPFVGRAGQLLNRMLQSVRIKREDVYICNVVKCRPPGNRTPERDEVEACSPFLFRQIGAIRPRLICCLGAPAVRTMLGVKEGILKIRGHFYDYGDAKALPTVHPAYILRNPREEKILREDFEKIRAFLKGGSG